MGARTCGCGRACAHVSVCMPGAPFGVSLRLKCSGGGLDLHIEGIDAHTYKHMDGRAYATNVGQACRDICG